ncbi:hypothetical protein RAD15_39015 [Bradyrhizobium sp. 14AA]
MRKLLAFSLFWAITVAYVFAPSSFQRRGWLMFLIGKMAGSRMSALGGVIYVQAADCDRANDR